MSAQQPKQSACNRGCGVLVHFSNLPAGRTSSGKYRPMEFSQTANGIIEQPHNCPNYQAPANPAPTASYAGQAAPPASTGAAGATGPSITAMLLDEAKQTNAFLSDHSQLLVELSANISKMVGILTALHPELEPEIGTQPQAQEESPPTQEGPVGPPSDELTDAPQ